MKLSEKIYYLNDHFVGISVSGNVGPERAITIARQYADLACQYPHHNILVDVRNIIASVNITNLMKVAQEIYMLFPDFQNKIAHLVYDKSERIRIARQLESCMVLKGYTYKVFTDFEFATNWLSKAS